MILYQETTMQKLLNQIVSTEEDLVELKSIVDESEYKYNNIKIQYDQLSEQCKYEYENNYKLKCELNTIKHVTTIIYK